MRTAHFPKSARLLKADEFSAMVRVRPLAHTLHFVLHGRYTGDSSRLGLVTGRKYARRAPTRNTIRRIGRELFRTQRVAFSGWDILIRLHRRLDRKSLPSASSDSLKAMCWDELQKLLAHAEKRMARSTNSNHLESASKLPKDRQSREAGAQEPSLPQVHEGAEHRPIATDGL